MQQYSLLWSIFINDGSVCNLDYGCEWVCKCTVQYMIQSVIECAAYKYRNIATKLILVMTNGYDINETQIGVFTIFFIAICALYRC
jgi:hypothetical protein